MFFAPGIHTLSFDFFPTKFLVIGVFVGQRCSLLCKVVVIAIAILTSVIMDFSTESFNIFRRNPRPINYIIWRKPTPVQFLSFLLLFAHEFRIMRLC